MENQEIVEKLQFQIKIPYNSPELIEQRKKQQLTLGIIMAICSALFIAMTVLSFISKTSDTWVYVFFGAFSIVSVIYTISTFLKMKPNPKDDNKTQIISFYDFSISVDIEDANKGTQKNIVRCLYRYHKNKQYVHKVIEYENKIELKVLKGYYNGAPQYVKHLIPKSVIDAETKQRLIEYLKEIFEKDYVIKQEKKK